MIAQYLHNYHTTLYSETCEGASRDAQRATWVYSLPAKGEDYTVREAPVSRLQPSARMTD